MEESRVVAEVAADFFDRPIAFARAVRVDGLRQVPNLAPEFARERVQALDEVLVPAAAGFAPRIGEGAH